MKGEGVHLRDNYAQQADELAVERKVVEKAQIEISGGYVQLSRLQLLVEPGRGVRADVLHTLSTAVIKLDELIAWYTTFEKECVNRSLELWQGDILEQEADERDAQRKPEGS